MTTQTNSPGLQVSIRHLAEALDTRKRMHRNIVALTPIQVRTDGGHQVACPICSLGMAAGGKDSREALTHTLAYHLEQDH